ncbi:MAG: hypothetical protein M1347_02720 [Chloroflexi bacterium]|nr:hypothetical protein [Chloroflexota bacterium]
MKKSIVFLFVNSLLFASSCSAPTASSPIAAIQRIQELAGFPPSELNYIETTNMANSPHGDLQVELYQDQEGRRFYVEPATNTVVEIDARDSPGIARSGIGTSGPVLTQADLASRAEEFVRAAIPEFSSLQAGLDYEAGEKGGDYFFFVWRAATDEIYFMPPFIQVGITNRGEMFAYYNTVTIP